MSIEAYERKFRTAKGPSPSAFPYIRLSVVEQFIPLAMEAGVADITLYEGRGFLTAYRLAHGEPNMLGREETSRLGWDYVRGKRLSAWMTQARRQMATFWTQKGHPTRRHLAMIMWAYTPDPQRLKRYYNEVVRVR